MIIEKRRNNYKLGITFINMKYKLVVFDLDGTIIDETIFIWQTIHDHLSIDQVIRNRMSEKFYNKEISYEEWALHDIKMWQEKNATKEDIFKALKPLKLMNGALETLNELKRKGIKLAIISGSLNIALEKVFPDYKDYFDYCFLNKIYFNEDGSIKSLKATEFDFEHKADGLKYISEKENIDVKDIVFVGDHDNDIYIAELAGFTIAFNSKSEKLNKIADVIIEKKDLREILKWIN